MSIACTFNHKPHFRKEQQPESDGNGGFHIWTSCERCGEKIEYKAPDIWERWRASQQPKTAHPKGS